MSELMHAFGLTDYVPPSGTVKEYRMDGSNPIKESPKLRLLRQNKRNESSQSVAE